MSSDSESETYAERMRKSIMPGLYANAASRRVIQIDRRQTQSIAPNSQVEKQVIDKKKADTNEAIEEQAQKKMVIKAEPADHIVKLEPPEGFTSGDRYITEDELPNSSNSQIDLNHLLAEMPNIEIDVEQIVQPKPKKSRIEDSDEDVLCETPEKPHKPKVQDTLDKYLRECGATKSDRPYTKAKTAPVKIPSNTMLASVLSPMPSSSANAFANTTFEDMAEADSELRSLCGIGTDEILKTCGNDSSSQTSTLEAKQKRKQSTTMASKKAPVINTELQNQPDLEKKNDASEVLAQIGAVQLNEIDIEKLLRIIKKHCVPLKGTFVRDVHYRVKMNHWDNIIEEFKMETNKEIPKDKACEFWKNRFSSKRLAKFFNNYMGLLPEVDVPEDLLIYAYVFVDNETRSMATYATPDQQGELKLRFDRFMDVFPNFKDLLNTTAAKGDAVAGEVSKMKSCIQLLVNVLRGNGTDFKMPPELDDFVSGH